MRRFTASRRTGETLDLLRELSHSDRSCAPNRLDSRSPSPTCSVGLPFSEDPNMDSLIAPRFALCLMVSAAALFLPFMLAGRSDVVC